MKKLFTSKMCEIARNPKAEVLDKTPIAIIAPSQKRPETLSQAINRIMEGSLSEDQWERLRGVEYDGEDEFYEEDDDEMWENFEDGTAEHDDQGYFENANIRNARTNHKESHKDTMETGEETSQDKNDDNEEGVGK